MKSLVTGINGFVGLHLASLLKSKGRELYGVIYPSSGIDELKGLVEPANVCEADISDRAAIDGAINDYKPDEVYHLAAQSHVPTAWREPAKTFSVNLGGTLNLLEAMKEHSSESSFLLVSTGDIYNAGSGASEDSNPFPNNPYSASKLASEALAGMYFESGPKVITVRAFNHTGPGQSPMFALSSFAEQIALAEAGLKEKVIKVGNLDAEKDYTDARDVVEAYTLALEKCKTMEAYNICSGKTYRIGDLLDILLSLGRVKIEVEVNEALVRPVETKPSSPSYEKFKKQTGWEPKISIEKTLGDLLNYWRNRVRGI